MIFVGTGVYPFYFSLFVILFNYLDTTPQAKCRFKYLSCINKDYWLMQTFLPRCINNEAIEG